MKRKKRSLREEGSGTLWKQAIREGALQDDRPIGGREEPTFGVKKGARAVGCVRRASGEWYRTSPQSPASQPQPLRSGGLLELPAARQRLRASPTNPSPVPRALPWQRRLAQKAPGRGQEVASRRRGSPGSASASPPPRRLCRPPPSWELVVSSVRGAALTQHRSPSARRTGSPERRSHAGRTRAGGAPATARGHRAQTGTATPAPLPSPILGLGPPLRCGRSSLVRRRKRPLYEGLEGLQVPGGSAFPALRSLLVAKEALLEQWFSKCGPRTNSMSITWELIRNARPKYLRILTRSQGD